jgi:hypothetical protein
MEELREDSTADHQTQTQVKFGLDLQGARSQK